MRYLIAGEVMTINETETGSDLLADFGLLEAAVLRPQQTVFNLNGHSIEADQGELVALALDVAEGQVDVETIAGILKGWAQPIRFPEE